MKSKKRASPRIESKDNRLELRLTTQEKEAFSLAAKADGRSLSNWVLQRCREAASPFLMAARQTNS
jgi:uncharacterized protein (DUF1778 family)